MALYKYSSFASFPYRRLGHTLVQMCGGKGIHVDTAASKSIHLLVEIRFETKSLVYRCLFDYRQYDMNAAAAAHDDNDSDDVVRW